MKLIHYICSSNSRIGYFIAKLVHHLFTTIDCKLISYLFQLTSNIKTGRLNTVLFLTRRHGKSNSKPVNFAL